MVTQEWVCNGASWSPMSLSDVAVPSCELQPGKTVSKSHDAGKGSGYNLVDELSVVSEELTPGFTEALVSVLHLRQVVILKHLCLLGSKSRDEKS